MRLTAALFVLAGCPAPADPCEGDLDAAAATIVERWPTARAALDNPYGACVWWWAHGRVSVDGFGATMVTLMDAPGIDDAIRLDRDVPAIGRLDSPSLLFFDQTDGPVDEWPLIGFGYHFPYVPCERPTLDCVASNRYFVHEAGYHHLVRGDGDMHVATDDNLVDGGSIDESGCSAVAYDDLAIKVGNIRHGRAWDLHVWLTPEPEFAVEDPLLRWADADERVSINGRAFFTPDDAVCDCPVDSAL